MEIGIERAVDYQVAFNNHEKLKQDVEAQRLYALLSESHDFFTIAALTEIELQESLAKRGHFAVDHQNLSADDYEFYATSINELTADQIFKFYTTPRWDTETRTTVAQEDHDKIWGNIAIILARDEPLVAFKCLSRIISDNRRLVMASTALFQQPANMNVRALIEAAMYHRISGDRDGNYGGGLSAAYVHLILGIAGDRGAADKAFKCMDIQNRYKQYLLDLYYFKGSRSSSDYYPPPHIIEDIVNIGVILNKASLTMSDVQDRLAWKDQYRHEELELTLNVMRRDPMAVTRNHLHFGTYSNVMFAMSAIHPVARHGVRAFAYDQGSYQANKQRDWNNWGAVKLDVDTQQIDDQTVMRTLAIPRAQILTLDGERLRENAEQLLGISTS